MRGSTHLLSTRLLTGAMLPASAWGVLAPAPARASGGQYGAPAPHPATPPPPPTPATAPPPQPSPPGPHRFPLAPAPVPCHGPGCSAPVSAPLTVAPVLNLEEWVIVAGFDLPLSGAPLRLDHLASPGHPRSRPGTVFRP